MKKFLVSFLLLFAINCSSVKDQIKDAGKKETILNITYDKTSKSAQEVVFEQDDDKQILKITNVKKNKSWNISYRDFKILTLGYKNWRVVENEKPEISKITEDDKWVNFTFNYYKTIKATDGTSARVSILSGTVSINKKVIRTNEEVSSAKTMKWVAIGTGAYSVIITVILFAIIL